MPPVRANRGSWSLLDFISASAGSTIDSVYANLVLRFGTSPPFFKEGWGDLGVVDFHEDARHFESWPPAHFDVKVSDPGCGDRLLTGCLGHLILYD